ncbi:MAG TPA: hypothetical protein VGF10_01915 [Gaiella sp.]
MRTLFQKLTTPNKDVARVAHAVGVLVGVLVLVALLIALRG